jgi:sugar/nucleoside kinase (ribokinase family)
VTRRGIVLAGSVILDIVHMADRWPEEETIAFVSRTEHGAGGPPHNAGAGLVKLGADFPVRVLGAAGDDALGDILLEKMQALGLDISGMKRIAGAVTSHTQVMTSMATGRRTFFYQPGVSALLSVDDLLPKDDSAKFFYAGSPGVMARLDAEGGWAKLLAEARRRGFKTCLELVPVNAELLRRYVPPCLPFCDFFVANDHEVTSVTGIATTRGSHFDWEAAGAACRRLLELGVGTLAAVHHPEGAVAVSASGEAAAAGSVKVPASDIVGTVGAGDAFYAGVLFGLHEDWPLDRCLALGNAAAATSLRAATTSASIRPWAECLAYAEKMGLRPAPA